MVCFVFVCFYAGFECTGSNLYHKCVGRNDGERYLCIHGLGMMAWWHGTSGWAGMGRRRRSLVVSMRLIKCADAKRYRVGLYLVEIVAQCVLLVCCGLLYTGAALRRTNRTIQISFDS